MNQFLEALPPEEREPAKQFIRAAIALVCLHGLNAAGEMAPADTLAEVVVKQADALLERLSR